jgi:hypothetical protein
VWHGDRRGSHPLEHATALTAGAPHFVTGGDSAARFVRAIRGVALLFRISGRVDQRIERFLIDHRTLDQSCDQPVERAGDSPPHLTALVGSGACRSPCALSYTRLALSVRPGSLTTLAFTKRNGSTIYMFSVRSAERRHLAPRHVLLFMAAHCAGRTDLRAARVHTQARSTVCVQGSAVAADHFGTPAAWTLPAGRRGSGPAATKRRWCRGRRPLAALGRSKLARAVGRCALRRRARRASRSGVHRARPAGRVLWRAGARALGRVGPFLRACAAGPWVIGQAISALFAPMRASRSLPRRR